MHVHIDCSFGLSGDMLLAALADAGADIAAIRGALASIPLAGFAIDAERTLRGGMSSLHIEVRDLTPTDETNTDRGSDRRHGDHAHGPHRHLDDMLALLNPDVLPERARRRAERIFRILAGAEAAVHALPAAEVHFHEVSGIDTAVDVIGSCLALDLLGVDSISASAPTAGTGLIMSAHGLLPVPAPATLEILKSHNIPWRAGGDGERLTPTGAALLAGIVDAFAASPELVVTRIGYGAGRRDFADAPNLARVIIGKPAAPQGGTERVDTAPGAVEAAEMPLAKNRPFLPAERILHLPDLGKASSGRVVEFQLVVDDMTPEAVAYLQEACFLAGAVEAYSIPVAMKKGRLGHEMTVLAAGDKAAAVADALWMNSTTFGIRVRETSRLTLEREMRAVKVMGETVRVKFGWFGGEIIRRQPEYEDCRAAALATGRGLDEIFRLAEMAAAELP